MFPLPPYGNVKPHGLPRAHEPTSSPAPFDFGPAPNRKYKTVIGPERDQSVRIGGFVAKPSSRVVQGQHQGQDEAYRQLSAQIDRLEAMFHNVKMQDTFPKANQTPELSHTRTESTSSSALANMFTLPPIERPPSLPDPSGKRIYTLGRLSDFEKLVHLKQTGTVSQYWYDFANLIKGMDHSPFYLIHLFVRGLKADIQRQVYRMGELESFADLVDIAIQVEGFLSQWHQCPAQRLEMDVEALSAIKRGSVPRGPLTDEEKTRRRVNHLCMYCGGPGHIAMNCPNKPNNGQHKKNNLLPGQYASGSSGASDDSNPW